MFNKIQLTWHLDNIELFEFVVMNPAAMDEKSFESLDIPEWDLESIHDHKPGVKIKSNQMTKFIKIINPITYGGGIILNWEGMALNCAC